MTTSMMGYTGPRGAAGSNLRGNTTGGSFGGDVVPKGYKLGQVQQFSPEQMQLFSQLFGHLGPGSFTSRLAGGDEDIFKQVEGPQMRQFQALQGQNASRFSGAGIGARRGSGFQNSQGQLTSDFAQDLVSKRQGLQRQALMDLMGFSNQLLGQRPTERFLNKKAPSFLENLGVSFGGGLGQGIGGALSGLFGGG